MSTGSQKQHHHHHHIQQPQQPQKPLRSYKLLNDPFLLKTNAPKVYR